ncbi:MAG: gluconolactonase [Alphaproteobacteria bacterium]|nr:MAG: gluconolactonase [Alphaproteobacteria bacterium]
MINRPADEIEILAEGLLFPEGPVWHRDGSVAFVEIGRGTVSRWSPDGGVHVVAETGGGPNGLAVGPDGAYYVCNNGGFRFSDEGGYYRPVAPAVDHPDGRIERVDPQTGKVERLYERCGAFPLNGPNDLVFDARGGFYFTDTGRVRHRDRDHGGVYYALADGSQISEIAYPVLTPNGIGLSPDGKILYVAEMEPARLWAYDILSPGVLAKQPFPVLNGGRLVVGLGGYRRLDSLAVAASGNICLGTLVEGCVTIVSPAGEVVGRAMTPDPYCTNICFGGPGYKTAFLTMSLTGRLGRCTWHEAGLKLEYEG